MYILQITSADLVDKRGYLTICLHLSKEGSRILLRKPEGIREWHEALKVSQKHATWLKSTKIATPRSHTTNEPFLITIFLIQNYLFLQLKPRFSFHNRSIWWQTKLGHIYYLVVAYFHKCWKLKLFILHLFEGFKLIWIFK